MTYIKSTVPWSLAIDAPVESRQLPTRIQVQLYQDISFTKRVTQSIVLHMVDVKYFKESKPKVRFVIVVHPEELQLNDPDWWDRGSMIFYGNVKASPLNDRGSM